MAKVITAPQIIDVPGLKVFLGGAIDMGKAINWQAHVIHLLQNEQKLVLLNPRRENFTVDALDEQIQWELNAIEKADIIMMWFPTGAEATISFLETGLYLKSGKLILGVEKDFYRRRNLELTCQHYGVPFWEKLDDLIQEILRQKELNLKE